MKAHPHLPEAPQTRGPSDALSFAVIASGRLREVFLRRSTLKDWTPVPDDAHGLLRAYDQHQAEIAQAVRRRAALLGDADMDEVRATDFVDWFDPGPAALERAKVRLSPIYCPSVA